MKYKSRSDTKLLVAKEPASKHEAHSYVSKEEVVKATKEVIKRYRKAFEELTKR